MENRLFDLARGASSSQGSGEASAAAGKGKKNRAPSPVLVREGQEAAGTETTSAWTGEKKTKIQSTPTSGDLDMISLDTVHGQEQEPEQIEGLDWDQEKLYEKIACCLVWLRDGVDSSDDEDDWPVNEEYWALHEQRVKELNERLALCRIRAYEDDYCKLDTSILKAMYPPTLLEQEGYYKHYECSFGWYFDIQYAGSKRQDYQLLVLSSNGDFYEDWECYYKANSTLEGDQQFVQFWEKLSSKTKLIELYLRDRSNELESLIFYHALKIAAGLPHFPKALFYKSFVEFLWSVDFYDTRYKMYASFFFDMRELIYKQKMNFKDALRHIYEGGKYKHSILAWEPNLDMFEQDYKPYLDRIGQKAKDDDAYPLIMEFIEKMDMRPKIYYDYAKKKLDIAKEIGLIPLNPNKSSM